jgi:hypothetical protein
LKNNSTKKLKELEATLPKDSQKRLNRRRFLWQSSLISLAATLPLNACLHEDTPQVSAVRNPDLLNQEEWDTLIAVQEVLFPHEKNAPGAVDINAAGYFQWVLADPLLDPSEIDYKRNGLTWLNEDSLEKHDKIFPLLSSEKKESLLRYVTEHSWGRSWISVMLLTIFEALLSDPIYGSNTDEKGWKWLDYQAGNPRPIKGKIYLDYTLENGNSLNPKNA